MSFHLQGNHLIFLKLLTILIVVKSNHIYYKYSF